MTVTRIHGDDRGPTTLAELLAETKAAHVSADREAHAVGRVIASVEGMLVAAKTLDELGYAVTAAELEMAASIALAATNGRRDL